MLDSHVKNIEHCEIFSCDEYNVEDIYLAYDKLKLNHFENFSNNVHNEVHKMDKLIILWTTF